MKGESGNNGDTDKDGESDRGRDRSTKAFK